MAETSNSKSESFVDSIKLHKADKPWKPSFKVQVSADSQALSVEEKIKRSSLSILNKLTPQKFEILVNQLKKLDIDTEQKLDIIVDLIYEKAINEPLYSIPYANMCKYLAMIKVPTENEKSVNFRKLLLSKCQKEFEEGRSYEKKQGKQKTAEEITSDKKSILEQEMYEEQIIRHRQLENIRFIGELFKLKMLIEPIIHESITKFLSQRDEESLECLCRLLTTAGKELDQNSMERMDLYFTEIQKIVDKRLTSTRIRFLLQDVADLRKNNWIPRRIENNPRTIEEIHREAAREAQEQEQAYDNYKRKMGVELTLQGAGLSKDEVKVKS